MLKSEAVNQCNHTMEKREKIYVDKFFFLANLHKKLLLGS